MGAKGAVVIAIVLKLQLTTASMRLLRMSFLKTSRYLSSRFNMKEPISISINLARLHQFQSG